MKKSKRRILILGIILMMTLILSGCSGSSSSGRQKCGYCGGAGYIRNGATNASEYAFMKKVCPRCGGSGYSN